MTESLSSLTCVVTKPVNWRHTDPLTLPLCTPAPNKTECVCPGLGRWPAALLPLLRVREDRHVRLPLDGEAVQMWGLLLLLLLLQHLHSPPRWSHRAGPDQAVQGELEQHGQIFVEWAVRAKIKIVLPAIKVNTLDLDNFHSFDVGQLRKFEIFLTDFALSLLVKKYPC